MPGGGATDGSGVTASQSAGAETTSQSSATTGQGAEQQGARITPPRPYTPRGDQSLPRQRERPNGAASGALQQEAPTITPLPVPPLIPLPPNIDVSTFPPPGDYGGPGTAGPVPQQTIGAIRTAAQTGAVVAISSAAPAAATAMPQSLTPEQKEQELLAMRRPIAKRQ